MGNLSCAPEILPLKELGAEKMKLSLPVLHWKRISRQVAWQAHCTIFLESNRSI